MASKSSNFLDGLEFYFMTKKPEKVQRFEITASDRFNENPRTHVLFPRGVNYHSGLHSFHSTQPQRKSVLCLLTGYLLVLRKGNPTSDTIRGKVKQIFR